MNKIYTKKQIAHNHLVMAGIEKPSKNFSFHSYVFNKKAYDYQKLQSR